MKFAVVRRLLVCSMSSPILVNFGLGAAPQKPIYKSHLGKIWYMSDHYTNCTWKKLAARLIGQSELGIM